MLFSLLIPSISLSSAPINLRTIEGSLPLGKHLEILEDPQHQWNLNSLLQAEPPLTFTPNDVQAPSFGFTRSAYWVRFHVSVTEAHKECLLELQSPFMERATLYLPNASGDFTQQEVTRMQLFNERDYPYKNYVFRVSFPTAGEHTVYLRLETYDVMVFPLVLWQPEAFTEHQYHEQQIFGIYYGMMLAMMLYNFFIFIVLRDRSYVYYVLFIICLILLQMVLEGRAYEFLWPESPWWNKQAHPFLIGMVALWGGIFTRGLLQLDKIHPRFDRIFSLSLGGCALYTTVVLFAPYSMVVIPSNIVAAALTSLTLFAGILSWLHHYRPARYFLMAVSAFLATVILRLVIAVGFSIDFMMQHGMNIGAALLVILLSFALADRISLLRIDALENLREKEAAKAEALKNKELALANLHKADQLKDEFLANTSHELRTPLSGIIGLAESLMDGATGKLPPETLHSLSLIVTSGRRLAHLVNDILDFSKLKNQDIVLQKHPVDLRQITEVVLTLSASLLQGKEIQLINDISPELPPVDADENRLQQILYNLIGNAIKFTEEGHIRVEAKIEEPGWIQVSVRDTGIGIPEDKIFTIFESFEQADASVSREYGGTGLGLSLTKQLVELHGGLIGVSSEEREGSCFYFTLPESDEEKAAHDSLSATLLQNLVAAAPVIQEESLYNHSLPEEDEAPYANILVVDDEVINRQVAFQHLRTQGYHVTMASDGVQALETLGQWESEGRTFDLILMDIMMPKMSGYEACRKIRESYSESQLPIILLTAKNEISDLVAGFEAGANDFLPKPFLKDELLARIQLHIQLAQTHIDLSILNQAILRFVPFQFLQALGKDRLSEVEVGDAQEREMSILFLDIRSFTALSEQMSPEDNFRFINSFLRRMEPVIEAYQGFIDKFLGDGFLALFDQPDQAVRAGVAMLGVLREYNLHRRSSGYAPIAIGIGINTGKVMIGTVGGKGRMDGTVISDAVNLASRIEGMTKLYNAPLLISECTFQHKSTCTTEVRMIDQVTPKGKSEPVVLYEVIDGNPEKIKQQKRSNLHLFENALQLYSIQAFKEAYPLFQQCFEQCPSDAAAQMYMQRCTYIQEYGVNALLHRNETADLFRYGGRFGVSDNDA